jgi:hypothetical protein
MLAVRPCGHAQDWIGYGAPVEIIHARTSLWQEQGLSLRDAEFSEAGPAITLGNHDCTRTADCPGPRAERATPRPGDSIGAAFHDLPPGAAGSIDPEGA